MCHFGKIESDVHINGSAEEFHELITNKAHHVRNSKLSGIVNGIDLHQGDWGKVGSIVVWNYIQDGKACVAKDVIEAIDPAKNSITFKVIEGDLLDHYKSFKATIQAIPKHKGSVIHWTFEYEKLHEKIPNPHTLTQLAASFSREIDAHLTKGQGHEEQLFGKVEVDVHINVSAQKFHEIFSSKPHHIPNMAPSKIKAAKISEGDLGKVGSVIVFHYVHDGKDCVAKDLVEAVDAEKNMITLRVIEGDILNDYKSLKVTLQAIPKDDKGSLVHWTMEYEKLKGHIPDPHSLLELAVDLTKDLEASLTQ